MAGKHPNIKGAGWRKEAQWVEFYCGSAKDVETLINNPVRINDTPVTFIKARKLYGDKLVLKLANINPSPGEDLIRETLMTALGKVALVEKVAPVYLKPEEGCPEEEKLCTRRWNALVYTQPDRRFVVHPTFQMHGTTVVITWKGTTCSVCHHCKEAGHWTEKCTPTHRTLAAQKRMKKLEPKKKETLTRKYTQDRQVRKLTTGNVSTRSRSKGTLPDYALYLLRVGMTTVPKANELLANTKPEEFMEVTRPGMSKQLYANFGKFVDRRKNDAEADTIKELTAYQVSIPECFIPGNKNFVDTSVAPKTGPKRKRRKSDSTVAAESSAEDRSETAQPITTVIVQYIDDEGKDATFRLKYTPKMRINTLAKAIKRKRKITSDIRLIRKADESILQTQKTATEAGLLNEEVIILDKAVEQNQDEEMEQESYNIQVKFLPKGTGKVINIDFPPQTTTVNMYMTFAQCIRKRYNTFTLYRSDGTPVNRYTSVEGLQLRHFEILREDDTEVIPMNINWLDNKKQHQHKPAFIPGNLSPRKARDFVRHELGLEFNCSIETEEINLATVETIAEANTEMTSNRMFVRRPGQQKWDDTEYQEAYENAQLQIRLSQTTDSYTAHAIRYGTYVIDIMQELAVNDERLRGRIILDQNDIPFDPILNLYDIVLPGTTLQVHLSAANSYQKRDIQDAIRKVASDEETTVEVIIPERFPNLIPLL